MTERDWFNNLLSDIDIDIGENFSEAPSVPIPDNAFRRIEINQPGVSYFESDLSFGNVLIKLETSATNSFMRLQFTSHLQSFDQDDMQSAVKTVMNILYPATIRSPYAISHTDNGEKFLGPVDNWRASFFEGIDTVIDDDSLDEMLYYLPQPTSNESSDTFEESEAPYFIYGFKKTEDGISEYIRLQHSTNSQEMSSQLAAKILERNKRYQGSDIETDAARLAKYVRGLSENEAA